MRRQTGKHLVERQPLCGCDATQPRAGLQFCGLGPVDLQAVVLQRLQGLLVLVVADADDRHLARLDAVDQVCHAAPIAACSACDTQTQLTTRRPSNRTPFALGKNTGAFVRCAEHIQVWIGVQTPLKSIAAQSGARLLSDVAQRLPVAPRPAYAL